MRRLLRGPLLHFVVLGSAIFAAYALVRPSRSDSSEIVVSAGRMAAIEAQFRGMRQRPPTEVELRALVGNYVREEVLYREGLARGFDLDDPVIRNRVRQKVEILAAEALSDEPTDADLVAYLAQHREQFEIPAAVSFEQVYFDPAGRGASLDRDMAGALAALRRGARAAELGDRTMEGAVNVTEPRGAFSVDGFTERWTIRRPAGLAGTEIHIEGLPGSITDVLARVEREDGTTQVARLIPLRPRFVVESPADGTGVAWTYLVLGVRHILGGVDHLLFVLALILIVDNRRRLFVTIMAFTLAHSITLAVATLGVVHVPQAPVEAAIALSIVFVAAEIAGRARLRDRRRGDVLGDRAHARVCAVAQAAEYFERAAAADGGFVVQGRCADPNSVLMRPRLVGRSAGQLRRGS